MKVVTVSPEQRVHILDGDKTGGGHRPGSGLSGKSESPATSTDDRIIAAIEVVANDPSAHRSVQPNGRTRVEGVADGINIRVIIDPAGLEIVTAHPIGIASNPLVEA